MGRYVQVPEGVDVRVTHLRAVPLDDGGQLLLTKAMLAVSGLPVPACGGQTIVELLAGGFVVAQGISVCRPDEPFNRKLSRTIALGRALKELAAGG